MKTATVTALLAVVVLGAGAVACDTSGPALPVALPSSATVAAPPSSASPTPPAATGPSASRTVDASTPPPTRSPSRSARPAGTPTARTATGAAPPVGAAAVVSAGNPALTYSTEGSTDTVVARRAGKVIATVFERSLTAPDGDARLELHVTPVTPFSLRLGTFTWEDAAGGEHAPHDADQVLTFVPGETASVTIVFPGQKLGAALWVPGKHVVATWLLT